MRPKYRLFLPAALCLTLVCASAGAFAPQPSLDSPKCVKVPEARGEQTGDEEIGVGRSGEYCAYPLRMLAYHRVVNDHLGGPPIVVSYDPESGAGRVFDPVLDGKPYTFDPAAPQQGLPALTDRETHSLWSAITGKAVSGTLAGKRLAIIPSLVITWARWKALHSDSWALAENPEQSPHYTERMTRPVCPLSADLVRALPHPPDARLAPDRLVLGIDLGARQIALPVTDRDGNYHGIVGAAFDGQPPVILFGDLPAHAAAAYLPTEKVPRLDFTARSRGHEGDWMDERTNSTWNVEGRCIAGPLKGESLHPADYVRLRWYAWAALHPGTELQPYPFERP
jgi:Protein of unknown function (DUF3179)